MLTPLSSGLRLGLCLRRLLSPRPLRPVTCAPPEYGGFLGSLGAQYDALFGQFDTDRLYKANRFIGHFFMCAWLTVSVVVLLNLLVGIMSVSRKSAPKVLAQLALQQRAMMRPAGEATAGSRALANL